MELPLDSQPPPIKEVGLPLLSSQSVCKKCYQSLCSDHKYVVATFPWLVTVLIVLSSFCISFSTHSSSKAYSTFHHDLAFFITILSQFMIVLTPLSTSFSTVLYTFMFFFYLWASVSVFHHPTLSLLTLILSVSSVLLLIYRKYIIPYSKVFLPAVSNFNSSLVNIFFILLRVSFTIYSIKSLELVNSVKILQIVNTVVVFITFFIMIYFSFLKDHYLAVLIFNVSSTFFVLFSIISLIISNNFIYFVIVLGITVAGIFHANNSKSIVLIEEEECAAHYEAKFIAKLFQLPRIMVSLLIFLNSIHFVDDLDESNHLIALGSLSILILIFTSSTYIFYNPICPKFLKKSVRLFFFPMLVISTVFVLIFVFTFIFSFIFTLGQLIIFSCYILLLWYIFIHFYNYSLEFTAENDSIDSYNSFIFSITAIASVLLVVTVILLVIIWIFVDTGK
ncbi:hypothetical protein RCL1_004164 [Eukaryota sp. TZLM3-RCL]